MQCHMGKVFDSIILEFWTFLYHLMIGFDNDRAAVLVYFNDLFGHLFFLVVDDFALYRFIFVGFFGLVVAFGCVLGRLFFGLGGFVHLGADRHYLVAQVFAGF